MMTDLHVHEGNKYLIPYHSAGFLATRGGLIIWKLRHCPRSRGQ
ncbi:unnamed protein product [Staurois parvus]|uniref:Uncharacterized protein n=1 Tax=Staurois parvus TaxID=386267 RepID=A0ABN9EMF7_9NEOB|nr:unnamed protein product [Staurois parvus]